MLFRHNIFTDPLARMSYACKLWPFSKQRLWIWLQALSSRLRPWPTQRTRNCQTTAGAKLAWPESGAKTSLYKHTGTDTDSLNCTTKIKHYCDDGIGWNGLTVLPRTVSWNNILLYLCKWEQQSQVTGYAIFSLQLPEIIQIKWISCKKEKYKMKGTCMLAVIIKPLLLFTFSHRLSVPNS